MDWVVEPLSLGFLQRALIAGALAAVTTSLVGTWLVLRGHAFLGDALAHGLLPGIALASLTGVPLELGAAGGALLMVGGINAVHRGARLGHDTGIYLLLVGMLATGVAIVSRSGTFAVDLTAYLFGDALGVTRHDIAVQAVAALVTVVGVAVLYRALLVLALDEAKAALLGLRPGFTHAAMLALAATAVVTSFRTVGALLVFGLLIAPPATAALLVRRVPAIMATAVVLGIAAVVVGLIASYHAGTAASATVAAVSVLWFFVTLAGRVLPHHTARIVAGRVKEPERDHQRA